MHPSSERPDKPAAESVVMSDADADPSSSSALGSSNLISRPQALPRTPSEMASDTDADSGSELVYYGHGQPPQTREDEPTSPTSPLAPYPPLAPTESRSRAPEFYGFVAWTSTYLLFALYLLWAFLPDDIIVALGVSWYPNRCVGTPLDSKRRPCSRSRTTVNLRRPGTSFARARPHKHARLRARPCYVCAIMHVHLRIGADPAGIALSTCPVRVRTNVGRRDAPPPPPPRTEPKIRHCKLTGPALGGAENGRC